MKKQRFFMLGIITVLVAVLSLTFVSSTFAKYTSTVSGSDLARVAKWAWEINDDALAKGATELTFNLFDTINDTKDPYGAETDVKAELLAPGTQGQFVLKFDNLSEVNATYAVDWTLTNTKSVPLEFSIDGTNWKSNLDELDIDPTTLNMLTGTATVTIQWRWSFDGDDTALGFDAAAADIEVIVKAAVTFTQVD